MIDPILESCRLAYGFAPTPGVDVYLDEPDTITGGPDKIDLAKVGVTSRGIMVTIRGTLHPELGNWQHDEDWLEDFEAIPTHVTGVPGVVHSGFWEAADALIDGISQALRDRRIRSMSLLPLWVVGHSKGGAVAQMIAPLVPGVGNGSVNVRTFGAPRVGDLRYCAWLDAKDWISSVRYEYGHDIVPHLPMRWLNAYRHPGELRYMTDGGQFLADTKMLAMRRALGIRATLLGLNWRSFVVEHEVAVGSGYSRMRFESLAPAPQSAP